MSGTFVAEFESADHLASVLRGLRAAGHQALDAFTPYSVDEIAAEFERPRSHVPGAMLAVGVLVFAGAYLVQWWSAVYDYPLNVGARPLNSWPVFLLAPFEVGVFAAALAGLVQFCRECGLPRLHDPLFEVPGFERATQDRFFLLAKSAASDPDGLDLRHFLEGEGARVTGVPAP